MRYLFLSTALAILITPIGALAESCGMAAGRDYPILRCDTCQGMDPCDACRHPGMLKHPNKGKPAREGKVCQSVRETKKTKKTCYKSECVEFCLPRPSSGPLAIFHQFLRGSDCGNGCRAASCDCPQAAKMVTCGKVRTKKKLYMREVEKEESVDRCEVKSCGVSCGGGCGNSCGGGIATEIPIEEAPLGPLETDAKPFRKR